jgi:hypothetical protein
MATVDREFSNRKGTTDTGQEVEAFGAPEITPEEFAEHTANMVANALSATKMFEVVEIKAGIGQVHIMGRVKREKERNFMDRVIVPILKVMDGSDDCNGFVGKQFLLKAGLAKYAWVISFASNDLRHAASVVCSSFEGAAPRVEVVEAPLAGPGTPQSGGRGTGRRGAAPVA